MTAAQRFALLLAILMASMSPRMRADGTHVCANPAKETP